MRYSCMSPPPPGEPLPWVGEGVPEAIERLHPGYTIHRFSGFESPGLQLFQVVGGRRAEGIEERYTFVEGVDEAGQVLTGRPLFLRTIVDVTNAYALAERALAILLRRADEDVLLPARAADIAEPARARVAAPQVVDRTLTFWLRVRSDMPYAREITVELDTGIVHGDPG